jgi:putative membrane protein
MGSADVVPGVSGGTIALVLGIYQQLVTSIRNGSGALGRLVALDRRGALLRLREVDWYLLVPLLLGVLTAVLTLAEVIEHQLEENPIPMSGLFLGLVTGSAVVALGLLTRRDLREWLLIAWAAGAFFVLLGQTSGSAQDPITGEVPLWAFFISGAVAICAMILPGVSGSFLLVVLGMYSLVLRAVSERDVVVIAVFGLGCVVGLALFSQLLHWALSKHYDLVMAIMIGLMLGSLRVLWPWPGGAQSVELAAPSQQVGITVALAVLGVLVVLGMDALAHRLEHRRVDDDVADFKQG